MDIKEILESLKKGKYIVFVDDKRNLPLNADYLQENTITTVESLEEGYRFCDGLHEKERLEKGRAMIRYRISNAFGDDNVASEDLDIETVEKIVGQIPQSPEDMEMALREIRKRNTE